MTNILATLLIGIYAAESSSGKDPKAYERGHHAAGPLQITEILCRDVCGREGWHFRWPDDCFDWDISVKIYESHMTRVMSRMDRPTLRKLALVWRYGENGAKRTKDREGYWAKVKKGIDRAATRKTTARRRE